MRPRPATQNNRPSFPPSVFHRSFMRFRLRSCRGPEVGLPEAPAVDLVARALVDERALLHDQRPVGVGQAADVFVMSTPSKRMVPASGLRSPAMVATVVVLPAPLRPKMTAVSPSSTAKLTPMRTGKP